jgi:hypothetical protein
VQRVLQILARPTLHENFGFESQNWAKFQCRPDIWMAVVLAMKYKLKRIGRTESFLSFCIRFDSNRFQWKS